MHLRQSLIHPLVHHISCAIQEQYKEQIRFPVLAEQKRELHIPLRICARIQET